MFSPPMRTLRLLLLALLVAALSAAAPATAQEPTPTTEAPLSNDFPESGSEEEQPAAEEEDEEAAPEAEATPVPAGEDADGAALADTGAEPAVVALAGLGLLLLGCGIRQNLAPGGRLA